MKGEFDFTGFKFVVKFFGQFALLYFIVSISSGFIFNSVYEDGDDVRRLSQDNVASVAKAEEVPIDKDKEPPVAVLGFVGDIMLDRGIEDVVSAYKNGDFAFIFDRVERELSKLDILFGNLEGPISDKGKDLGSLYSFRMNPDAIKGLVFAGFDVLSVANNHTGDFGEEAIGDSISRLKDLGIKTVGASLFPEEVYSPVIFETNGLKVAFFSFAENTGAYSGSNVALATEEKVKESIALLSNAGLADFIVAHFHFGDEYQKESNEKQKTLSRAAVDAGANLVVGSHPHVTQDVEKYKESFIFYSLGNFVFDQTFSEETMRGWLLKVFLKKDGGVSNLELCDVFINGLFQPVILSCSTIFDFKQT